MLVNSTNYKISKGKALVGWTVYDVQFEPDVITLVDSNGYLQGTWDTSGASSGRMREGATDKPTGSSITFNGFEFYYGSSSSYFYDRIVYGPVDLTNYNHLYSYGVDIYSAYCAAIIRFKNASTNSYVSGYYFGQAGTKSYQSVNYSWYMNYSTGSVYTGDISALTGQHYIELAGIKQDEGKSVYQAFFSNTWITKA